MTDCAERRAGQLMDRQEMLVTCCVYKRGGGDAEGEAATCGSNLHFLHFNPTFVAVSAYPRVLFDTGTQQCPGEFTTTVGSCDHHFESFSK